ncbi:hypothetical protein K449DRAFT_428232 [Hypoxylon sp. EC38]|nr:hypothetical protein K449DRAFT_428232 [Hypoxylon sp. EC38]
MSHTMDSTTETTKTGKRKGTRSVSTLTPSQLARKRANDREAQRAIRARTKEHIENLEREIEELRSQHHRDQTIQALLRRNKALEDELHQLRKSTGIRAADASEQFQSALNSSSPVRPHSFSHSASSYPMMQNIAYNSLSDATEPWAAGIPCSLSSTASSPTSSVGTDDFAGSNYIPTSAPSAVFEPSSVPPQTRSPTVSCVSGEGAFDEVKSETPRLWMSTAQHRAYDPNLQFSTLEHIPHAALPTTSDGRSTKPQRPADSSDWEMYVLTSHPSCRNDALLIEYIEDCRRLVNTTRGRTHTEVIFGPARPNAKPLLRKSTRVLSALGLEQNQTQDLPSEVPKSLSHPLLDLAAALFDCDHLNGALERVGSFLLLQGLVAWLIQPTKETYHRLGGILTPQPSQKTILHPQWIDLLFWPTLRDAVTRRQEIYANEEFRRIYGENLRIQNWNGGITGVLLPDHSTGAVYISKDFEEHIWALENWVMGEGFIKRYPDLAGLVNVERHSP